MTHLCEPVGRWLCEAAACEARACLHARCLTHAGAPGTGGKPSLGEEAAVESHDALAAAVNNADMVRLGPDAAAGGSAPAVSPAKCLMNRHQVKSTESQLQLA